MEENDDLKQQIDDLKRELARVKRVEVPEMYEMLKRRLIQDGFTIT